MKPAIDAAKALADALTQAQQLVVGKADAVSKAVSSALNAEQETAQREVAEELARHTEKIAQLEALIKQENADHDARLVKIKDNADNRAGAFAMLSEAILRLTAELRDGNDDGAALIAQAFAPTKFSDLNGGHSRT
jgi:hypothetical protein